METCQLCWGSGWIPGVAWADQPLDEEPCPECRTSRDKPDTPEVAGEESGSSQDVRF